MVIVSNILQTPALVIDDATVNRNLKQLATYAREYRVGVRPHTKTHKSLDMPRRQMIAGAIGLTAAKVGEAELMADAAEDILLAYPAVDAPRCQRLAQLARNRVVHVAVDSATALDALSIAAREAGAIIGILVDFDIGFHRTGVQTPAAALELAQKVACQPSLRLDGLFFYPGHAWVPADSQERQLKLIADQLNEALHLWSRSGFSAAIVSGGSTPTAYQSHLVPQ